MYDAIDLAHVEPFDIGELHVEPSSRSIRGQDGEELIEPRVLQLLIALAEARGRVLSRDDLIRQVWGGRIVGENAIQRAVSRLRIIAAGLGRNSFTLETVKGVGYKLVAADQEMPRPLQKEAHVGRRAVLAGVGLAVAAAGATWWAKFGSGGTGTLAEHLFNRAEVARRDQEDRTTAQHAAALYRRALREDPGMAEAWGGLALAYKQLADAEPDARVVRIAQLALAAANQALELDGNQPQAQLARIVTPPVFGHWQERIAALHAIGGSPDRSWELPFELCRSLADCGQFHEAIRHARASLNVEPMLPRVQAGLFRLLWSVGRLVEAEMVLDDALDIWPRRWTLWNAKFQYLALAGRTTDALNFLRSETDLPLNLQADAVDKRIRTLRVLSGQGGEARDELIDAYVEDCRKYCTAVPNASLMLAALGANDALFTVLNGHYFAAPPIGRQLTPYSRRWTIFLYMPPFDPLRADKRFTELMERIGLPVDID